MCKNLILFVELIGLTILVSCSPKKGMVTESKKNSEDVTPVSSDETQKQKETFDSLETYVDVTKFKMVFAKNENLSEVLNMAAQQNKMVFLDVNASWCTPCKLMQRDVYTDTNVANYFNDHFINYMVDIEKNEGPDLKIIFDIQSVPTLLWLDPKGRVINRHDGALYHRDLLAKAEAAINSKR